MALPFREELTRVQFVAVIPDLLEELPPRIYVALSIDGWSEQGRALEQVAPGIYSGVWPFVVGARIEYKFIREPAWATVEKAAGGGEIPNRVLRVAAGLREQVVVHTVSQWADRGADQTRRVEQNRPGDPYLTPPSTCTGIIRAHHRFVAPQFNNARTILVYLPPAYDDQPQQRFPVLYMHDGQNVFDARTSFGGVEWEADETAERLILAGEIEPLIIVAIYNNEARLDEYTPFRDPERGGGQGDDYLAFIVETLKPVIDRTYRTLPGREHTAIAGSSLGGLISLYAPFRHAGVFGKAAALSPSLQWAEQRIFDYLEEHPAPGTLKLWIDAGSEETLSRRAEERATRLADYCLPLVRMLRKKGYESDAELHFEEVAGARHHERDWGARFDRVLKFLFPHNVKTKLPGSAGEDKDKAVQPEPPPCREAPRGSGAEPRADVDDVRARQTARPISGRQATFPRP